MKPAARKAAKPLSLTQFLIEEQRDQHHINADLRLLIEVVARACKSISIAVGKGALGGVLGSAGTENVQGEVQKKLDMLSNEILLEANEMYEANPIAFVVERASGMATTGLLRILDIVPTLLHQRVPVFLGSKNEIERVTQYQRAAAQD